MKKPILSLLLLLLFAMSWNIISAEKKHPTSISTEKITPLLHDCDELSIDIALSQVSPFSFPYLEVLYCNNSEELAVEVVIEIFLDEAFTYQHTDPGFPFEHEDHYFVGMVGNLEAGECGQFAISLQVHSELLPNFTYTNEASITSSDCTPVIPTEIELSSTLECNGSGVDFTLRNESETVWEDVSAIIVQEDVILLEIENDTFNILEEAIIVQEDVILLHGTFDSIPAQDSLVFSVALEEPVGFVQLQVKSGTAHLDFPDWVEGCEELRGSGFPRQYLISDANPSRIKAYTELDGLTNFLEIFDSKPLALPEGFSPRHFIEPNTAIEYTLHFFEPVEQFDNNQVVVTNVLSSFMDESSVIPGATVRPATFEQSGNTFSFTFDNPVIEEINGQFYANGFVRFKAQQNPDLTTETEILHEATITINGNPVRNLHYFHTIAEQVPTTYPQDGVTISAELPESINICGEPDTVTITITNQNPFSMGSLEVHTFFPNSENGLRMDELALLPQTGVHWLNRPDNFNVFGVGTNPIFLIDKIAAKETLSFHFLLSGDCTLLPFATDNPIELTFDLVWNFGHTLFDSHLASENDIALQSPQLTIELDHPTYEGTVGETFTRTLSIRNTGAVYDVFDFFILHLVPEDVQLDAISTGELDIAETFNLTNYAGYTVYRIEETAMANTGNGDRFLETGEVIEIQETLSITGCENLQSQYALLWGCSHVSVANGFCEESAFEAHVITEETPNEVGDCINTAVEDVLHENVVIYPNPSSGKLNVVLPLAADIQMVEVYNVLGEKVEEIEPQWKALNEIWQVDLADVERGVYLLKFQMEEKCLFRKIVLD